MRPVNGKPRLGYLGGNNDHLLNLKYLFASLEQELPVYLDWWTGCFSKRFAGNRTGTLIKRVGRAYSQFRGLWACEYRENLLRQLDENQTECILAYWGTNLAAEIITIKKQRPRVKIVLNVLCHPTGLHRFRVTAQNQLMRRLLPHLDGIIYSSAQMKSYFETRIGRSVTKVPSLILPPFFSQRLFPDLPGSTTPPLPGLIFVGRLDWWASQPCDKVQPIIDDLLNAGIHVHHNELAGNVIAHPNRHTYRYLSLAQMIQYASQFDASLVAYNTEVCQEDARFRNTVPDRVVASVAAGIPIALPRKGYEACKEYLAEYKAVIEFSTPDELRTKLQDRQYMEGLHETCRSSSRWYIAEDRIQPLLDFVRKVSDC